MDLRAAHEMFGLDSVIFRPHNVYGEHQNIGDRYRNVIGIFMNQIMNDQPLTRVRRRRADACLQLHRRRRAADRALGRCSRRVNQVHQHRRGHAVLGESARRCRRARVRRDAEGDAPAAAHRGRRRVLEPREGAANLRRRRRRCRSRMGSSAWRRGRAASARARAPTFDDIEIERNMPPSWRALTT